MRGARWKKRSSPSLDDADGIAVVRVAAKGIIRETRPEEEKIRRFRGRRQYLVSFSRSIERRRMSHLLPSVRATSGFSA
jgi:hypothetical protein